MESLIAEIRNAKEELKAGRYDEAYVMLQNVDDELTSREIKKLLKWEAIKTHSSN